jgi:hypothetical protein
MLEPITELTLLWRYGPPPDASAKVLLLTTGRIVIVGKWGDGLGVIAWHPLPKRDKKLEEELGL